MSPTSLLRRSIFSTSIFFFSRLISSASSISLLQDHSPFSNLHHNNPSLQEHPHQWKHSQIINAHIQKREHLFSLLQSCSLYTHLLQLHAQFIRTQFFQYPRLSLKFLSRAAKLCPRNVVYLHRIFTHIPVRNLSHYNTMIRAFSCSDFPIEGVNFYELMRQRGVFTDHLTMSFCLDCCTKFYGLFEGMQVHGRVLVDGYVRDCVLMTSLMELYSLCGRYDDACKVFDDMPHRDTVAYCWTLCFDDDNIIR